MKNSEKQLLVQHISNKCDYNGFDIAHVFQLALEDANFHTEAAKLEEEWMPYAFRKEADEDNDGQKP